MEYELEFEKTEDDVAWFRSTDGQITLDIPRDHYMMSVDGKLVEYTINKDGEYHFITDHPTGNLFIGRQGNKILAVIIEESGAISETYIYRLKETVH